MVWRLASERVSVCESPLPVQGFGVDPPSASSNMNPSAVSATPLTEVSTGPEKRRSYLEAVSSTNLAVLEDVATPRQAKSADPLWLPSGKPIQL